MPNTLIEKLTNIKTAKENLKTALEGMGLNPGNDFSSYANFAQEQLQPAGGNGIKLFSTIEEMNADSNPHEGDLAIVYRSEIQNMTADMEVTSITFPETVTLPVAFTDITYCRLRAVDSSIMFDGNCQLDQNSFRFDSWSESGMIRAEYTSTDGITYTRTRIQGDNGDLTNPVELPTTCKVEGEWNDNLGYFMQIGGGTFEGLYQSQSIKVKNTYILDNNRIKIAQYDNFNDSQYALMIKHKFSENEISEYTLLTMNKYIYPFIDSNNKLWVYNSNLTTSLEEYSVNAESYSSRSIIAKTSISNGAIVNDITDIGITVDLDSCIPLGNPLYSGDSTDVVKTIDELTKIKDISTIEPEQVYELKYLPAPTQLSAISGYVYEKEFYGKNGIEIGTLGAPDNSFADINAEIYNRIQNQYKTMEPRVLTDNDKIIDKNIYFIPTKNDGTPLLDISRVTNMMSMFYNCDNLINIPQLNTDNVTNMFSAFENCNNLKEIAQLNTNKVTNMQYMFRFCVNLVIAPQINTGNVTDIDFMFGNCTNLVTVPLLDISKVTSIENMFYDCPNLSDESLNNILAMCANATAYITQGTNMTLAHIGLTSAQATRCQSLSNYQAFLNAGWTTGY